MRLKLDSGLIKPTFILATVTEYGVPPKSNAATAPADGEDVPTIAASLLEDAVMELPDLTELGLVGETSGRVAFFVCVAVFGGELVDVGIDALSEAAADPTEEIKAGWDL